MNKINVYELLNKKEILEIDDYRGVEMEILTPFPNLVVNKLFGDISLINLKRLTKIIYDDLKFQYNYLIMMLDPTTTLTNEEKIDFFEYIVKTNFENISIFSNKNIVINLKNQLYSENKKIIIKKQFNGLFLDEVYTISFKNDGVSKYEIPSYLDIQAKKKYNDKSFFDTFKHVKAKEIKDFRELPQTENTIKNMQNQKILIKGEVFLKDEIFVKTRDIFITNIYLTDTLESTICSFRTKAPIKIEEGDILTVCGIYMFDEYTKLPMLKNCEIVKLENKTENVEKEKLFRTELNLKTADSQLDGILSLEKWFENFEKLGINAVAFPDYNSCQNAPDLEKLAKKYNVKPIYSTTLNMIDDENYHIYYKNNEKICDTFVCFDIETTGFSVLYDEIIEISAIKFNKDGILNEFHKYLKLEDEKKLSEEITNLTDIDLPLLERLGEDNKKVITEFYDFIKDACLIGHNITFDYDFIKTKIKNILNVDINNNLIDTLNLSRALLEMKYYSLDRVATKLGVGDFKHHSAYEDTKTTFLVFKSLMNILNSGENILLEDVKDDIFYNVKIKISSKKVLDYVLENITYTSFVDNNLGTDKKGVNQEFLINIDGLSLKTLIPILIEKGKSTKILEIKLENSKKYKPQELDFLIKEEQIINSPKQTEIVILVKNNVGKKELYKLISKSLTERLNKKGKNVILKSDLTDTLRKNVLIGTSNALGYVKNYFEKGNEALDINFYDYIEISPINTYLSITNNSYQKYENIKETIYQIVRNCFKNNKLIVYSSNGYYINYKEKEYREIYTQTEFAGNFHPLRSAKEIGDNICYKTSDIQTILKNDYNFKDSFIEQIVFNNPEKINQLIDNDIWIEADKLYVPKDDFFKEKSLEIVGKRVESVKEEFLNIVNNALEKYKFNGKLFKYVKERVDKELKSLIDNGFYIIYYISYLLVKKSNDDGYVVGSRGSVGSSFVAYLMGITEVNPLKPHYICPNCHRQFFKGEIDFGNLGEVLDGFDLEDEFCPCCNHKLEKDGHDIPFETFLGFEGEKVPDIDLNFSGIYQPLAHNFCKEVFGDSCCLRAGTTMTVAEKTAEMYVEKYCERKKIVESYAETKRKAIKITGTKRSTGQHPAGIVVCPDYMEITDFTPYQYPANKKGEWFTTHFDYHKIDANLLKLDILGHDDPTMLKMLMDIVKENPENYPFTKVSEIPVCDKSVFDLLREDNEGVVDALGISEFGTSFVMGMLKDINIESFSDLVKVSGLSHGKGVWLGNSFELCKGNTNYGEIPFKKVIGCRDDIMVELIKFGVPSKEAFQIMEIVRKGKVKKEKEKWEKLKLEMIKVKVPNWYIWSLEQIEYMFPKAHAVAYVMSALRIAWFKAHRPLDFYQTIFSVRADNFEAETIATNDISFINAQINIIKGDETKKLTATEEDTIHFLTLALEMIKKGFNFKMPNINLSDSKKFLKLDEKTLLMPFSVLKGVGEKTALKVVENRKNGYKDFEDFKKNSGADKNLINILSQYN